MIGSMIPPASLGKRVTALEDKNVNFEYWEEISSGLTGTIVPPTGSSFVLDQWPGDVDAVVSTVDTGNVPDGEFARTAGGAIVTVTLDSGGNFVISDTPSSFPVAIIYPATVPFALFDSTTVLGQPELDEGSIRAPSLDPHGTVSSGTEEISFNFTDHSLSTAGSHTWTFADDSDPQPDTSLELVVTSITTITTPSDAAFFSAQTLSALATGTYQVEIFRLTEDATKNYGIAVGVKQ